MADKKISDLPSAGSISESSRFVAEQDGAAVQVTGGQIADFAEGVAQDTLDNLTVSSRTLTAGASATVRKTVTNDVVNLEFGIPQGNTGEDGLPGNPGVGVPSGGTDGQYLRKSGSEDYETFWSDGPNIHPDAKTEEMTQSVGVDGNGKLWTAPGSGGSDDYTLDLSAKNLTWTEGSAQLNGALLWESSYSGAECAALRTAMLAGKRCCIRVTSPYDGMAYTFPVSGFLNEGATATEYNVYCMPFADTYPAIVSLEAGLGTATDSIALEYAFLLVGKFLPYVTASDNGKQLIVSGGLWTVKALTWTGTQAQYDALGSYDSDVTYNIVEAST